MMGLFQTMGRKIKRSQYLKDPSDDCKLVVMSDRAYRSVIAEACSHMETETGGILLGRQVKGVWFVTEVIDPGLNVTLRPELFSYDPDYVNHLVPKISAIYDYQLEILGIWHRHPGSMDFFSSIDDASHDAIIHQDLGRPIISMLVNFDPVFRRTMYFVDGDVNYRKVELLTGDDQMIPEFLRLSGINNLFRRFGELKRSPDYEAPAEEEVTTVTESKVAPEIGAEPAVVAVNVDSGAVVVVESPAAEESEEIVTEGEVKSSPVSDVVETDVRADEKAAPVEVQGTVAEITLDKECDAPQNVAETVKTEVNADGAAPSTSEGTQTSSCAAVDEPPAKITGTVPTEPAPVAETHDEGPAEEVRQ